VHLDQNEQMIPVEWIELSGDWPLGQSLGAIPRNDRGSWNSSACSGTPLLVPSRHPDPFSSAKKHLHGEPSSGGDATRALPGCKVKKAPLDAARQDDLPAGSKSFSGPSGLEESRPAAALTHPTMETFPEGAAVPHVSRGRSMVSPSWRLIEPRCGPDLFSHSPATSGDAEVFC